MANKGICAVILAAGSSSRMNSGDKTLAKLGGIPVAALSMRAFQRCDKIDGIILVTRAEKIQTLTKLAEQYGITKLVSVIEGGVCRQQSSYMGVLAAKDFSHVLIHDCARPLVSSKLISAVCAAAEEFGAAIPAVPVKDTVKIVGDDGFVLTTPKRSSLYSVQTPQGFDRELYFKAMQAFGGMLEDLTDDSSLFEQAGYRVKTVTGSYKNIKITTDSDLSLCKTLIKEAEYD